MNLTGFPLMKHITPFFRNNEFIPEFREFLDNCFYCKKHEHACSRDIDLTLLLPAVKHHLSQFDPHYTWTPPNTVKILPKVLRSPHFYRFWRNLNSYIVPQHFRDEYAEFRMPQKREVVFFSGCGIQLLENQYYTLCAIMRQLGVDFGLIDGSYEKAVCCGAVHCTLGNFAHGTRLLRNLIRELHRFETRKVVVYCATCYFGLKVLAPQLLENYDLEVQHATGFLADVLARSTAPKLAAPLGSRITCTIHDSCHLAHGPAGDTESVRKLLSLLPGVTLAEMTHCKNESLCDLSFLLRALKNPLKLFLRNDNIPIIGEALQTDADVLCSLCPGCHAILSIFGSNLWTTLGISIPRIPVQNWVSIVAGYLGISQRDMLTYRFAHLIAVPFRNSGLWYLWQVFKAFVRGFLGKREPKRVEHRLKRLRTAQKRGLPLIAVNNQKF